MGLTLTTSLSSGLLTNWKSSLTKSSAYGTCGEPCIMWLENRKMPPLTIYAWWACRTTMESSLFTSLRWRTTSRWHLIFSYWGTPRVSGAVPLRKLNMRFKDSLTYWIPWTCSSYSITSIWWHLTDLWSFSGPHKRLQSTRCLILSQSTRLHRQANWGMIPKTRPMTLIWALGHSLT